jgi:hypothetical protein
MPFLAKSPSLNKPIMFAATARPLTATIFAIIVSDRSANQGKINRTETGARAEPVARMVAYVELRPDAAPDDVARRVNAALLKSVGFIGTNPARPVSVRRTLQEMSGENAVRVSK